MNSAGTNDPYGVLGGAGFTPMSMSELASLFASPAPPAPATAVPALDERCPCGGEMHKMYNDVELICAGCGLVAEGTPEPADQPKVGQAAQLRIVGIGSNQLQPDLYRSNTVSTSETQVKQVLDEYCLLRKLYIEAHGKALFPLNVCSRAAAIYNLVQRIYVKRSYNKLAIMAWCLYSAGLEENIAPSKAEIARFMRLPTLGIARGANFIRELHANGEISGVDVDIDPTLPEINSIFAHLNMLTPPYEPLRVAVQNVVRLADERHVGTSSILRSKVAAATFVVLHRVRDPLLVPRPPTINEFCTLRIRKNTIERFMAALDSHHTLFAPCYQQAGLYSEHLSLLSKARR